MVFIRGMAFIRGIVFITGMVVITGICLVAQTDVVRFRPLLLVLAAGKAASSLASLGFYLFHLALLTNIQEWLAPDGTSGDCATGESFFGQVANSPLHTHSSSGLIHIESDRRHRFTLGEFFDEWGVRLDARCLGGYCGSGKLRVFVDGRRRSGDPRRIVLGNHQEIAVVFGSGHAPRHYAGVWPGAGCGGNGEPSCVPS